MKDERFEDLYGFFKDGLNEIYPSIRVDESYPSSGNIKTPCFIVECPQLYPSYDQPNDGEKDLVTRWEIRSMVSKKSKKNADYLVRDMAINITTKFADVKFIEWAQPCECHGSSDGSLDNKMPYESWVTEFEIKIRAGEPTVNRESIIGYDKDKK